MRVGTSFRNSFVDFFKFIEVALSAQESWGQVPEEDLSVVSVLLLFDFLNDFKEFRSVEFTLGFVALVVEEGAAVDELALRKVCPVYILVPASFFVSVIWKACLTLKFSKLINV